MLIDLDETLYLRNSTEDFIDSATPAMPAVLALRLLDLIKPWRFGNSSAARDWWRVRLIALFCPWVWRRWRNRVEQLAADSGNKALQEALRAAPGTTTILTAGFRPIVEPLIAALAVPSVSIISSRFDSPIDRERGKLWMAEQALGPERVRAALVLTDSTDDLSLLAACAKPLLTQWPGARYRPALTRAYLPGLYLTRIKRPGQRYLVHGILIEDFAFWLLTTLAVAAHPVTHVAGLLLLLGSFWAIYERGYVDNDWVAEHYESDPRLSRNYGVVEVATPCWQPWLWAITVGGAAIMLLRWPETPPPGDFAKWLALLIGTFGLFKVYNRLDKRARIWMFPALQFARAAAFIVLLPVGLVGAVALAAHVIARWIPYFQYRVNDNRWPDSAPFLSRLLLYIVLWTMLAVTVGTDEILTLTALAVLLWNILRARNGLSELVRTTTWITRKTPRSE